MTFNKFFLLQKYRPARSKVFACGLITTKSILFFICLNFIIVQHVAGQKNFVNNDKLYSSYSASSPDRFIDEKNFNSNKNPLVIQTVNGPVLGKRVKTLIKPSSGEVEEHEIDAFLGLQYGLSPTNKLRFQRPLPLNKSWTGSIFNATSPPDACVQLNDTNFGEFRGATMWNANTLLSEDCLTLSVWAPATRLNKPNKPLPVLVWIFGGAFFSGSIALDLYDGAILAARGDVILVSINYRVASFGFLFLDREDAPGSVGVLDQLLALRWIKKNIGFFGGDENSITLFGESAGAATITYLILSPLVEDGLFHRAILQSGAATSPWALMSHETGIYRSLRLAENLGCIKPTSKFELNQKKELVEVQDLRRYKGYDFRNDPNLVKCLQEKDPLHLISNEPKDTSVIEFNFVPVVDGYILPQNPSVMIDKYRSRKIPILLGANTYEAIYFLVYHIPDLFNIFETINIDKKKLESIIRKQYFEDDELILDAIVQKYTNWKNPDDLEVNIETIDHVFGDRKFVCPMNAFAKRYSVNNATIFQYVFAHRSSFSAWPRWMGTLHGDEINFIFGEPLRYGYNYTVAEVKLSERMMAFWVNFAKFGDPSKTDDNLPQLSIPIKNDNWIPYTEERKTFKILNLNISDSVEFGPPRPDYCSFWNDYVPKFKKKIKQRMCSSAETDFDSRLIGLLCYLAFFFNLYRSMF